MQIRLNKDIYGKVNGLYPTIEMTEIGPYLVLKIVTKYCNEIIEDVRHLEKK